ncbi:MAG: VOC family protein [Bacteroidota bacterium]
MQKVVNLLGSPTDFLDKIFQYLQRTRIDVRQCELDHICYRVETLERYEALKIELATLGEQLTESIIGGRPIASFKLNEPIFHKKRQISVIELPAPKQGSFYKEGYEHVEFVIDISFLDFMKQHSNLTFFFFVFVQAEIGFFWFKLSRSYH